MDNVEQNATPKVEGNIADQLAENNQNTTPDNTHEPMDTQELLLKYTKLKRSFDKTASEAADYKKRYRATLSEQEKANAEKAEAEAKRDEEMANLKRTVRVNELTENYMDLGYGKDLAKQAAVAFVDNDNETLFKIQKDVQDKMIAEKQAEWLKTIPQTNTSSDDEAIDPFLVGFNSKK